MRRRNNMRYSRQNKIIELINSYEIDTQEKLASMLRENGFEVTQATISRDIKDLQLVKTLSSSGKYKYALNKSKDMPVSDRFVKIFRETITSFAASGNLIVVKTLSGCAAAAGEAIDKCSKVMGLGYPGGPIIDRLAREGNPKAFHFAKPNIPEMNYSFSGLKTSFLYFLRDKIKENPQFIEENKCDLAASLEATIVDILMKKLKIAVKETGITHVALSGGVSANTGLRQAFKNMEKSGRWKIYIPKFSYTTDNAAMIAITGYYKFLDGEYCPLSKPAYSRTVL